MQLFLIRHADALPLDETMDGDEARPLSEEGHQQIGRLASAFRRLDARPDILLSSPLVRARQTAELLAGRLGRHEQAVEETAHLAPGGSQRRLLKLLRKLGAGQAALVGHEPDLGRLAARLVGGKRARIEFAKGGIACIACDDPPRRGAGVLLWMLTPMWMDS